MTNRIVLQNQTKLRQMQQQQMLNQTGGNNLLQMQQYRMNMPPNGMNNMQKQALQNTRPGYVYPTLNLDRFSIKCKL